MISSYEVLVIGSGAAGSGVAMRCARAGLATAIVDHRPYGGTCAIRGCDPKKILVDAAAETDLAQRLPQLVSGNGSMRWEDLIAFKDSFVRDVPQKRQKSYRDAGIVMLRGRASFVNPDTVSIGQKHVKARTIVIATGARPRSLGIEGEGHLLTSDDFLDLQRLPDSIAFVGGGFISFEFAHVAKRFCKKVSILHADDRPLPVYDREVVDMLLKATRQRGIEVDLDAPVDRIEKQAEGLVLHTRDGSHMTQMAIHGAGRVPDVDGLDLKKGAVQAEGGILVNEFMQSISNPRVYAAGDAAAGLAPLTPVAVYESKIAAENIIHSNTLKRGRPHIPSTLFSIPPLAGVGLTEEALQQKGIPYRKVFSKTERWYHIKKAGYRDTAFKVLIGKESDLVLGAHILAPHAEDTINLVAMAMECGLTAARLKETIWTYPSITSDLKYML